MTKLGCCFHHHEDQNYQKLIIDNFDLIIPESAFKWNYITSSDLITDFTLSDNFVNFAIINQKKLSGVYYFSCLILQFLNGF